MSKVKEEIMGLHQEKKALMDWLEANRDQFTEIADQIWAKPEILWEEFFASNLQAVFLEEHGFKVTKDVGGMNTAIIAEFGEGRPIIGIAGEYDALPGLSQKAQSTQEAVEEGGHGHGCGHNLLGTAGVAAAVAIKKWLQESGSSGTIRYYGCPAEEGGGGKVFMARDGLFDDLDCAFAYHPGSANVASKGSCVAVQSSRFRFKGISAHAGGAPHLGRSALDAVELMNVAANYLREHVKDGTRIQYIITNGGQAANIVPETAEVEYILRAEKSDYLEEVSAHDIAKGAALMTGAKFERTIESAYSGILPNFTLADLFSEAMAFIGPLEFTEDEIAFAQEINDAYPGSNEDYAQRTIEYYKPSPEHIEMILANKFKPLVGENFPALDTGMIHKGATDVGDLSLVTPTGSLFTTCFPTGSPGHSWANVAAGGMSIGHKGMMHAAKAMAIVALDLYAEPGYLEAVRGEFNKRMGGKKYECPIPADQKPPRIERKLS
jgi:aminobenzoyl-glutamate utilization protein B